MLTNKKPHDIICLAVRSTLSETAGRGQCGSSSVVEHHLAKVGVAGSSPVFRSIIIKPNNFFYRTDFGAMNGSVKSYTSWRV